MVGIEDREDILWEVFLNINIWDQGKKFKWKQQGLGRGSFIITGKIKKEEVSSAVMEYPVFSDLVNYRHIGGWTHARSGFGIIGQLCLFEIYCSSYWLDSTVCVSVTDEMKNKHLIYTSEFSDMTLDSS